MDLEIVTKIIVFIPIILFSLTIHEYSHGWMALKCGDSTARDMGRLTMNPIKHLDPLGTIMMIGMYISNFIPFGWAKPVPIDPRNFGNPKRDIMLVSLAGPVSNLIVVVICIILYRSFQMLPDFAFKGLISTLTGLLTLINMSLALFNLLPFPPLDGSKILIGILPNKIIPSYLYYSRYAGIVFIGLILLERFMNIKTISFILEPLFIEFFGIISFFLGGGAF